MQLCTKYKLHFVLVSIFLILVFQLNAHLFRFAVWQSKNPDDKIYLFSENHDRSRASLIQTRNLLHFLQQREASLIVEDPSSTTDKNYPLYDLYKKRDYLDRSLYAKASFAHLAGIKTTNVEFRTITKRTSIEDYCNDSKRALSEIDQYDDGPIANEFYRACIMRHKNDITPKIKVLFEEIKKKDNCIAQKNLSSIHLPKEVYDIINLYRPTEFMKYMSHSQKVNAILSYYNAELLDAKLIHAIIAHKKLGKKRIVVCAGDWHISNLQSILLQMGYSFGGRVPLYIDNPLELKTALQQLEPEYNPNAPLPKTMADLLLDYTEFEHEHPHLIIAIPAGILATLAGAIAYLIATIISSSNAVQQ